MSVLIPKLELRIDRDVEKRKKLDEEEEQEDTGKEQQLLIVHTFK